MELTALLVTQPDIIFNHLIPHVNNAKVKEDAKHAPTETLVLPVSMDMVSIIIKSANHASLMPSIIIIANYVLPITQCALNAIKDIL